MKQIKFKDLENDLIHGGILLDDGDVVCGCCGGLIEKDEFEGNNQTHKILEIYPTWIDISDTIIGD